MYTVKNLTNINQSFGQINLAPGGSTSVVNPSAELYTAVSRGVVSVTPALPAEVATTLTDNSGGTASTTLAAIAAGASYSQADMQAAQGAIASLAKQLNTVSSAVAALQVASAADITAQQSALASN